MLLSVEKTKKLLEKYNIPLAKGIIINSKSEALEFAKETGFPVVLKLSSPKIIHKTEIKGVIANIDDENTLLKECEKISLLAKQKGSKTLMQKMEQGLQLIAGAKYDPVFGPVIMFGLGGIYVEIFKDISLRIAPIKEKDAQEMMQEIKGYKLLEGFRGKEGINKEAVKQILLNLSNLVQNESNIKEIDFNPIIANKQKATVVDAKLIY
jgi:acetate---CoA ligase (ADP-forming)